VSYCEGCGARLAAVKDAAEQRRAEYLHIGGPQMRVEDAAARLGVTPKTVTRWRAALGLNDRDVLGRATRKRRAAA
jgi:uncharacterized protein YjcR